MKKNFFISKTFFAFTKIDLYFSKNKIALSKFFKILKVYQNQITINY
jgi:hypothetical protein